LEKETKAKKVAVDLLIANRDCQRATEEKAVTAERNELEKNAITELVNDMKKSVGNVILN
jgi:hypothetical protein